MASPSSDEAAGSGSSPSTLLEFQCELKAELAAIREHLASDRESLMERLTSCERRLQDVLSHALPATGESAAKVARLGEGRVGETQKAEAEGTAALDLRAERRPSQDKRAEQSELEDIHSRLHLLEAQGQRCETQMDKMHKSLLDAEEILRGALADGHRMKQQQLDSEEIWRGAIAEGDAMRERQTVIEAAWQGALAGAERRVDEVAKESENRWRDMKKQLMDAEEILRGALAEAEGLKQQVLDSEEIWRSAIEEGQAMRQQQLDAEEIWRGALLEGQDLRRQQSDAEEIWRGALAEAEEFRKQLRDAEARQLQAFQELRPMKVRIDQLEAQSGCNDKLVVRLAALEEMMRGKRPDGPTQAEDAAASRKPEDTPAQNQLRRKVTEASEGDDADS